MGPLVAGIAVDRWGSWTFPFYVTASVYACGALAWLAIDPTRRLTTTDEEEGTAEGTKTAEKNPT